MMPSAEILRAHARQWTLSKPYDPNKDMHACVELGVKPLSKESPLYPALLRGLTDAPEVLYARGHLPLSGQALALVGSRRPTSYGLRMSRLLASECAHRGIPVVSGLARGIDSEAHKAVVDAGGVTWAVLGSGLDRVYPRENSSLAESIIASGGAMLSEVPMSGAPVPENFPRRNRIISGLCWGVIVVEGDLRSGSLITARVALAQGREVFAVPGPADSPLSEGPNELIRQGARMIRRLEDVLEDMPALRGQCDPQTRPPRVRERTHTLEEKKILELLGSHALGLEELLSGTGWDASRLIQALSAMEAKDLISPIPGQRYARI